MKISIVTPTYNRSTFLNDTIESIVTQKGDFEIEYIIQDGGSDEKLLRILTKWEDKIKNNEIEVGCNNLEFRYFSERDEGMYDAINKGFARSSGDVMAWLNSDDMYHPFALQTVSQIFKTNESVKWLTGIPNSFNCFGSRSGFDSFPSAYSKKFIRDGYYRLSYIDRGFNWIQQESTFWRRDLWEKIGSEVDTSFQYAADFDLWQSFAQYVDLVKVESFLGGFRIHEDQFTADPTLYTNELAAIDPPSSGLKVLRALFSRWPDLRRLFFNEKKGAPWLKFPGIKYEDLVGRVAVWSFVDQEWKIRDRVIV